MRRASRRDDTEPGIVKALEAAGWTVIRISDTGAPDLLAIRRGVLTALECKSPGGTLTPAQQTAFMRWAAAGLPVKVVRTPEEALMAVGAPVEGVLQPIPGMRMVPVSVGAAMLEAMKRPPREGQDDARDALGAAGHIVTPAYQKAQTEAVVPKPKRRPTAEARCGCGHLRGFHASGVGVCMVDEPCPCERYAPKGRKP